MQTLVVRVRTGFYVHTEDSDKMEELLRTTLAEFCDDGLRLLFEWCAYPASIALRTGLDYLLPDDIRMPQGYIPIVPPEMTLEREWHCSDLF
ncbi:hypothetical protein GLOTRDRAFT_109991 [Gloeophyllum trabeum ATCC 11539]|uniref:Uncharacterized protein n=1 Tax=Gloeophyllum trabeum (strain ATCC 11539 / FP-39264 / Madison 617) TaxID=670483 RepID=S7QDZ3_GLOTA|nr:uncharacterized protein GLOTRDRAFT_109991 [Gloeophyllum trabeum ATCC 11539]EPQ58011.1 hypothetical protein GLOTRDRAFT_109991 [Gloeophyllum trabeum ATCC 11539]